MPESVATSNEIGKSFDQDSLSLFWHFITERQKIWYRRVVQGQKPPWTNDEILQKYRFTNIYRQLDPGTQYVIQNILEADETREDKIFNVMVYRLIGRLKTHEFLGFLNLETFSSKDFERSLKIRRDTNEETIFTGAYMVAGYNQAGKSDKVENISVLFGKIAEKREFFEHVLSSKTAESAYLTIKSQPGFGNFLAYQTLVDLLYPVDYYNGDSVLPFSPNEWASPGPGAKKGINRLLKHSSDPEALDVMRWLQNNQQSEFKRLDCDFPYLKANSGERVDISLANIQNCLCEFYKYYKILNSNGRARRRFRELERRPEEELSSIYQSAPGFSLKRTRDQISQEGY